MRETASYFNPEIAQLEQMRRVRDETRDKVIKRMFEDPLVEISPDLSFFRKVFLSGVFD